VLGDHRARLASLSGRRRALSVALLALAGTLTAACSQSSAPPGIVDGDVTCVLWVGYSQDQKNQVAPILVRTAAEIWNGAASGFHIPAASPPDDLPDEARKAAIAALDRTCAETDDKTGTVAASIISSIRLGALSLPGFDPGPTTAP
jgi:hypothetical protein